MGGHEGPRGESAQKRWTDLPVEQKTIGRPKMIWWNLDTVAPRRGQKGVMEKNDQMERDINFRKRQTRDLKEKNVGNETENEVGKKREVA